MCVCVYQFPGRRIQRMQRKDFYQFKYLTMDRKYADI